MKSTFRFIKSITLPSLVLAIGEIGTLLRIVRSSMLDSLKQDYMDMARVKGLSSFKIYIKYALRGALTAPLTIIGMQFAKLAGGTVVVETIFALPGLGRLVLTAVEHRDIVLLQGLVMFVTSTVIIITLIVDISVMFLIQGLSPFNRGTYEKNISLILGIILVLIIIAVWVLSFVYLPYPPNEMNIPNKF